MKPDPGFWPAQRWTPCASQPDLQSTLTVSVPELGKGKLPLSILDMKKRVIEGVEVQRSSGNVYADMGLPHADKLKIKSGLVIEIRRAIRQQGLPQHAAAKRMGITLPKVSSMMRGDFSNLSERKLMDCLNRLRCDIEIKVRPASDPVGHLSI